MKTSTPKKYGWGWAEWAQELFAITIGEERKRIGGRGCGCVACVDGVEDADGGEGAREFHAAWNRLVEQSV